MALINNLLVEQFYRTTVTKTVALGGTLIEVENSSGFPEPTGAEYFYLTLVEGNEAEVVTVTDNNTVTNTLTVSPLAKGFSRDARAEHWFTAQAFNDIQTFLATLTGGGTAIPPDTVTIIDNGSSLSVGEIDGSFLTENGTIDTGHLAGSAVESGNITNSHVTNIKIDPTFGIDASKIKSFTGSKLALSLVQDTTTRSDPADTLTAGLDFLNVAFEVIPLGNTPSGGTNGQVAIEWEDI